MKESYINVNEKVENIEDSDKNLESIISSEEYYVYEYYIEKSNEVFYVGKGRGNRAWRNVRNHECEKVKSEHKWNVKIVKSGLKEDEALEIERQLIEKYRKEGVILTNIMPGNSLATEKEKIGYVKYLVFLIGKNVLNLSLSEIGNLLLINPTTVWSIAQNEHYHDVEPLLPENIGEIVHRYHVNSYTEDQIKIGNIKYILDLMHRGVLNLSQAELANYYGETAANISSIKNGHTHKNIPLLIPDNIGDILRKYDVFYISEEEKKRGMVMFIIRLRKEGIIKITNRDIGKNLDVSSYIIAEFTRSDEERKYTAKEYRPNGDVMAKLSPYFVIK